MLEEKNRKDKLLWYLFLNFEVINPLEIRKLRNLRKILEMDGYGSVWVLLMFRVEYLGDLHRFEEKLH